MSEAEPKRKETRLHFGEFTLNLSRRGLFRGTERVRLTSKPLEALIFLVENRGRVVEKQEILDAVWKDTFVTEDTLVHAVREIRRALSDDRDNPRFIQTVPRQGYRFVCVVAAEPADEPPPAAAVSATLLLAPPQISHLPVPLAHGTRSARRKLWLIPVPLVLAALIPASVWVASYTSILSWLTDRGGSPQRRFAPPRPETQRLLTLGAFSAGKPALSADGKLLLFVSSTEETQERMQDGQLITYGDLFIYEFAAHRPLEFTTDKPLQITERENPSGDIPVFAADGSYAVFACYPKENGAREDRLPNICKVLSHGDQQKEPFIAAASGAGFSPDGQYVAYTKHLPSQKTLWLSPVNDRNEHREIAPVGFTPRWSWDGKWIAYTTSNPNGEPGGMGDLWIVDAATLTQRRNLTQELQQMYGLTWTPDSRSIIFASKRTGPSLLWRVSIDGGPPEPVLLGVGDYAAPSMSRTSNTLVFSYYNASANLMLAEGLKAEARNLTRDESHRWPRLSPKGERIATVMEQPETGEHLYVIDLKTGNATRLSDRPAHHPCWLEEETVAYLWWDKAKQQTSVLAVNITKNVTTPLATFDGLAEWLAIHPDGKRLAVVLSSPEGKQRIVLHDLERKTNQTLVEKEARYACLRWSPDGSTLSWSGPERESGPESNGIWTLKLNETEPRRIVKDGYGPVWSADGSTVFFSRIREQAGLWSFSLKERREPEKIRTWKEVYFFDLVEPGLVFRQVSNNSKGRVYAAALE